MKKRSDPFNPACFSLSDFKKWMESQQKDNSCDQEVVGMKVEPKIGLRKLIEKIESEEDATDLAKDFRRHGGIITEEDGNNVMVEVESGSFIIAKNYIKKK